MGFQNCLCPFHEIGEGHIVFIVSVRVCANVCMYVFAYCQNCSRTQKIFGINNHYDKTMCRMQELCR